MNDEKELTNDAKLRPSSRMDPTLWLTDEIMFQVLSFVGGKLSKETTSSEASATNVPPTKKTSNQEGTEYEEVEVGSEEDTFTPATKEEANRLMVNSAAKFYMTLSLVSKGWKAIMDKSLKRLATDIECAVFFPAMGKESVEFLRRHKLSLGSLTFRYSYGISHEDFSSSLLALLKDCDTVKLAYLDIIMPSPSRNNYNLQRTLLDGVAEQCPNVTELSINLYLSSEINNTRLVTLSFLFSLARLASLRLDISDYSDGISDSTFVTSIVENLPSLQYLFLESSIRRFESTTFHIQSASLQQLLVENFSKHVSLSLDCPKLQVFRCKGFTPGHGHVPNETPVPLLVQQKISSATNIPSTCLGLVVHVCHPQGLPIGMPFQHLLQQNVEFLPVGNPHQR